MPADSSDSGCSSGLPSPTAPSLLQPDYQDQELAPGISVGAAILAILTAEYAIEDDETTAFVVAHEMAHHDLGHLRAFPKWLGRLAKARGVDIPFGVLRAVEHRLYGPEWEYEADDFALQLCLKAGCLIRHESADLGLPALPRVSAHSRSLATAGTPARRTGPRWHHLTTA
jgi:hypothetical protein